MLSFLFISDISFFPISLPICISISVMLSISVNFYIASQSQISCLLSFCLSYRCSLPPSCSSLLTQLINLLTPSNKKRDECNFRCAERRLNWLVAVLLLSLLELLLPLHASYLISYQTSSFASRHGSTSPAVVPLAVAAVEAAAFACKWRLAGCEMSF